MENEARGFIFLLVAAGIIGALLGFGFEGTAQAACKGAGFGMLAAVALIIMG